MAEFEIKDGVLIKAKGGIDKEIIVPDGVTVIGFHAFYRNEYVKQVILPKGVQKICSNAFDNCYRLEKILVPDTVTTIEWEAGGRQAFLYCGDCNCEILVDEGNPAYYSENGCLIERATKKLIMGRTSCPIPKGIERIGDGALRSCVMNEITIPGSVKELGDCVFDSCYYLRKVVFSEGVMKVGKKIFTSCGGIEIVTIPSTLTDFDPSCLRYEKLKEIIVVEDHPVYKSQNGCLIEKETGKLVTGCKDLTEITIPNGVTEICNKAFAPGLGCPLMKVVIPESVTKIGEGAFYNCNKLISVRLPSGLTQISDELFVGCKNLKSVFIPKGVTKIGESVFDRCESLEEIEIEEGNPAYRVENRCLIENATGKLIFMCKGGTLPSGVKIIGESVSNHNKEITELIVPDGVTEIGEHAFRECENLRSIFIPNSVKHIGAFTFADCPNLKDITLSEGIETIGGSAFQNVAATEIKLPNSVKEIRMWAFADSKELNEITIPKNVTVIEPYTYKRCCKLSHIVLHEHITKIGEEAFLGCGFEELTIPGNIKAIGKGAFSKCYALKCVVIEEGVTRICEKAFDGCELLESVSLPESLKEIGTHAFRECYALTELTIPSGVTKIGKHAFRLAELICLTIPRRFEGVIDSLGVDTKKTKVVYSD